MNRRHFMALMTAGAAGFALDPERLLWTPGQKTIFLPPSTNVKVGHLVYYDGNVLKLFTEREYWGGRGFHGVVTGFNGWVPNVQTQGVARLRAAMGQEWMDCGYPVTRVNVASEPYRVRA